jgi:hypothetical protein
MTINKKTRDNQIELNFKINETFYRKQIKKIMELDFQINKYWRMKLKKHKLIKEKKTNPDKSPKLELISQTNNLWNLRPRLNREAQFSTKFNIELWNQEKISI